MSDKSFGDHMNRGIVKNPLLSTAVTGMSIDDLTQNAVLLPVSLTHEQFGKQEPAQSFIPAPYGDTFTPIHPPEQNAKNPQKDDFDVNEYFARLQGTRYVSAPINTHLNDLEDKEENLEEINLNEPVTEDVQQSITADIAQNFSQLPTVLPQVASAVFSSFSNMLSMKREEAVHAPAQGAREPGAREMGAQEVSLMGVSEMVAPPPKEPPVTGPGNFRLTTKKKYAQIPGLSSGEPAQMPTYTPPALNQPIFTPPRQEINANLTNTESNKPRVDVGQSNVDFNVFSNTPSIPVETSNKANVFESPKEGSHVASPQYSQDFNQQGIIAPPPMFSNLTKRDSPNVGKTILPPSVARRIGSNKPTISNQAPAFATFDNIFVPAPIASDVESSLPSNTSQPLYQTSPPETASFAAYPSHGLPPQPGMPSSTPVPPTNIASSANVPNNVSTAPPPTVKLAPNTSQISSSTTIPTSIISEISIPGNLPPPSTNFVAPPAILQPVAPLTSYAESASILSPPQMYSSGTQPQIVTPPTAFVSGHHSQPTHNIPPPAIPIPSSVAPVATSSMSATTAPPQMFNPYVQSSSLTSQPPAASEMLEPPNQHVSILKSGNIDSVLPPRAEPPKIPEPPKASGSTSFRMTKKRPQYYSGPIEGVGAISNNVKPTLPPVAVTAFQGAVFTPEAGYQAAVFTPENVTDNVASTSQSAIFKPVAENQNESSMFTPLNVNVNTSNTQHAFDLNKTAQTIGAPYDINKASESSYGSYNTSFDMSRQVTDIYEPPKQESTFGIIGSLKSKLSSIDINKLQNSVTTFFDPGYNAVKSEAPKEYQDSYGQNQGIEIFVANPEMRPQPYQYDAHQANFTYGQGSIPNASDYYNQQPHNVYSNDSYYSQPTYGTQSYSQELQGQQTYSQYSNVTYGPSRTVDTGAAQATSVATYQPTTAATQGNTVENTDGNNSVCASVHSSIDNITTGFQGQFVNVLEPAKPQTKANIEETLKNLQITEGSSFEVNQEITDAVGVPVHSSKDTTVLHSQIEGNVQETLPQHKENIEEAFKTLQVTDRINFIDNQQLTGSFGALSVPSGRHNMTAEFQGNLPVKPQKDKDIKQEFKILAITHEVNKNIDQRNVTEDALNKNMVQTAGLLNPEVDTASSYFGKENTLNAEKSFLDIVKRKSSSNYFDMSENSENQIEDLTQTEKSQLDNMFSAPLHDLSSIIADRSKKISDNVEELDVNDEASNEEVDFQAINERLMALADSDNESLDQSEIVQKVDLCEPCREVNHPEGKPADFTSKLIENITAPILLSNAVEMPLPETHSSIPDDFDTINQGAEISLIACETIEALQIQSATELLDEDDNTNTETDYGWRTEPPLPLGPQTEKSQLDNMFSAPLHDLSSIIADRSKKISDNVDELDVNDEASNEEVDFQAINERLMALADSDNESLDQSEIVQKVDLCESCREVNHPEGKPADFTSKLIENITAPILLSNAVEVPLPETHSSIPDDFDTINQGAEISLIAGETIEALQIQSATELLDEDDNTNTETDYGWRTEPPLPLGQDLLDHDYTFTDPNTIGFFGNNKLFFDDIPKNASDEIKAEYTVSHDEAPIVLQREMSIPTAPPAEDSDDANSDETGVLDVQSIEQDASKDFPVFEEFVIEPCETDDDKLESKDKKDEIKDTFTNRVERFKQLEGNEDGTEHKANSSMMPSYFDTGNYAAETHFKNSLSSPPISSIPPGFEDYKLMPKDLNKQDPIKVPDTGTQTSLTTTISNVLTNTESLTTTVSSKIPSVQESQLEAKLPDFSIVFGAKIELKNTSISSVGNIQMPAKEHTPVNPQAVEDKVQENKFVALPDPLNFFASTVQEPDATEGVNRLASYFASPAKTDTTKSFFELSQGQNHYRQKKDDKIEGHKPFFELSQSQDHYKENINIPQDRLIANLNLMNDLTSCQNIEPTKEQVIRTVNYFTVEYDNPDMLYLNKGEPEDFNKKTHPINKEYEYEIEETVLNHDEMLTEIVNKCKYCRESASILTVRETDFDSIGKVNFRQAMDSNASKAKEGATMERGKEGERSVSVTVDEVSPEGDNGETVAMMTENRSTNDYEPVKYHWFYRVDCEDKSIWRGFSTTDSRAIESAFQSPDLNEHTLVATDGGRYDVNVVGRLRIAVYWTDKPTNVRRCSWFYKGTTDARYVPYTENVAEKLEVEYHHGITTGEWHRRLVLPNNELVVMHGPAVMVHFLQSGSTDPFAPNLFSFGKRVYRNPPNFKVAVDAPRKIDHLLLLVHGAGEWRYQKDKIQSTMRPRVVRRGSDESEIEDPEPSSIDHLLLLCHGVGSACDMRFRAVEEVVDDFRSTSLQLLQSHYRNSCDSGIVGRVEVLPISWHGSLHSGPKGVDRRLARVTLASIPRLRNFTNDTVLDVLFYTSPHYCQMILDTVCSELNRIYTLFVKRNPDFKGEVSLGGHSLGSVILYDLLCNQPVPSPLKPKPAKTYLTDSLAHNPTMQYPTLCFQPLALYALGSPIAIFECIRGVETLGAEFCLPTCRNFFNIFHPYDPIAYRIEPLVNAQLQNVKPSLIPHHKGRKRMHLELKDTMARVGADLKQKVVESIRSTWSSMWSTAAPTAHQLEKVVEEEIEKDQLAEEISREEPVQADLTPGEMLGRLNSGRRVDYVLQEAPFEMINEYLFAMTSHVCYWESEDVMLLILREIYDSMGVQPDVTVPQQSMSVQRITVVRDGQQYTANAADASTSRT